MTDFHRPETGLPKFDSNTTYYITKYRRHCGRFETQTGKETLMAKAIICRGQRSSEWQLHNELISDAKRGSGIITDRYGLRE